jgi:hypothetical protein
MQRAQALRNINLVNRNYALSTDLHDAQAQMAVVVAQNRLLKGQLSGSSGDALHSLHTEMLFCVLVRTAPGQICMRTLMVHTAYQHALLSIVLTLGIMYLIIICVFIILPDLVWSEAVTIRGCQGINDTVNPLLRCSCSRAMLDKKDKSYVCC